MNKQKHIRFDWAIKKIAEKKSQFRYPGRLLKANYSKRMLKSRRYWKAKSNKETSDDKYNRVDILAKDSRDQLIIVKIQNTSESDYFYKIYYKTAKAITEHIKESEPYTKSQKK